jgi:enamine deaminase RidA (YjgF/YER057c/UK114 family)
MSDHRIILPPGWPRPRGYSNGVLARGRVLAIAGEIAWDEREQIVSDEFVAQFRRALANVLAVVTAAGGRAEHLVQVTVYVTDKREYIASVREVGTVWRELVGATYPAMALVQVAALLDDRAKVEIAALAVLPDDEEETP